MASEFATDNRKKEQIKDYLKKKPPQILKFRPVILKIVYNENFLLNSAIKNRSHISIEYTIFSAYLLQAFALIL